MTQAKRWMVCLFLLYLALVRPALAEEAPGVPALRGRVNDYAAVLGASAGALEAKLSDHERASGHQVVVLTVPDLGGRDIESYANDVFHAWKLGRQGVDDGVLIVLAVKERSARIEVGYGLEGTLTDLASSRILRDTMHPRFAAGDLAGGTEAGVDAVLAVLAEPEPARPPTVPRQKASLRDLFYTALGYLSALLFMALFFWCAVTTGGLLSLGYLLIPSAFALAIWGWPAGAGSLLAQLAGVYVIRYRLMLGHASKEQQRSLTRSACWPPRFMDVWLWPGFGDKGGKRRKDGGSSRGGGILGFLIGMLFRVRGGGGSGSAGSGFSGGGGDSGGGGGGD